MLPRQNAGAVLVRSRHRYLGHHQGFRLVMAVRRPPRYHKHTPISRSLCEEALRKAPTGENSSFCTSMRPIFTNINRIIQGLEADINETEGEIEMLLRGGLDEGVRRTRAPLEIVGELSKTVFGTAMEKEVRRLSNAAQAVHRYLNNMSNYTVKIRDVSVQYMNATAAKIESISQDLLEQAAYIKHIAAATEETKRTLASVGRAAVQEEWWIKYIMAVMTSKLLQAQTLRGYLSYKREFVTSLEKLRGGKVSAAIIPTGEMMGSINEVGRRMTEQGYRMLVRDLGFYYDDFMTVYTFSKTHLYLTFQIPVARKRSSYQVFRITVFPVPINSREHVGYSKLTKLPDYIFINNVTQSYIEARKEDLDECVADHLLLCPIPLVVAEYTRPSCALGLYLNDRAMTEKECTHTVTPAAEMPTILMPAGGSSVIASHGREGAILVCKTNKTIIEPCSLCRYTIPCNCSIHIGDRFVDGMDPQCMMGTLTVEYAINIPVIDAFKISLRNASLTMTYKTPLDIILPNITSYIRRITQKYGTGYALDLRRYASELGSMSPPGPPGAMEPYGSFQYTSKTVQIAFSLILSVMAAILAGAALYRTNRLLGMVAYASAVRGNRIQLAPPVPTLPNFPTLRLKEPTANIQDMISAMTYQEKIMTGVLLLVLFYIMTKALRTVGGCIIKTCCKKLLCGVQGLGKFCGRQTEGDSSGVTEVWLKVQAGRKIEMLLLGTLFDDIGVVGAVIIPHIWVAYVDVYCLSSVLCLSANLTIDYQIGAEEKRFVAGDRIWASRLQGARMRAALNRGGESRAGEVAVIIQQGTKRRQLIPTRERNARAGDMERRGREFRPQWDRRGEKAREGANRLYPNPTPSSPELGGDPEEGVGLMNGHYGRGSGANGLTPPPPPKYDLDAF